MVAALVVLDVALHAGRTSPCSAGDIASRLGLARRGIEPVLQALTRAGLLAGVRGPAGGYRLGRPRREVLLSDVAAAVAEPADAAQPPVVGPLWDEMDALLARHLSTLTLADLVQRAAAAGMQPRPPDPLDFAI